MLAARLLLFGATRWPECCLLPTCPVEGNAERVAELCAAAAGSCEGLAREFAALRWLHGPPGTLLLLLRWSCCLPAKLVLVLEEVFALRRVARVFLLFMPGECKGCCCCK